MRQPPPLTGMYVDQSRTSKWWQYWMSIVTLAALPTRALNWASPETGIAFEFFKRASDVFSCNISFMQLLKPLTLLLFVLVSVNSFAQSYKVTVKEVRASCQNSPSPSICFVGVDNSELTPLCGPVYCGVSPTIKATLSLPSRWTNDANATLRFPAPGKVEGLLLINALSPSEPAFGDSNYRGRVEDSPSAPLGYGFPIKATFRLPAFDVTIPTPHLPDPGECIENYLYVDKKFKRTLRVAANQIAEVRGSVGSGTMPPGLVAVPDGQIARMKTKSSSTIPLRRDIGAWFGEVCNTEIQGYIDISLAFRAVSPIDYASWDFSGGLWVSASPTDETLKDYVGTIDGGAIIFSSDVEGALTNAEDVYPDTISTSFRYEEDTNPDDDILGWMDIDFSSLPNQQWQSFRLDWVYPDGQPHSSEFGNVFAMGLGQLVRTSPGSSPLSMKLPVIKKGGDPMTLTIPMGVTGNSLTIEYALFGASGSDSPYMPPFCC